MNVRCLIDKRLAIHRTKATCHVTLERLNIMAECHKMLESTEIRLTQGKAFRLKNLATTQCVRVPFLRSARKAISPIVK